MRSPWKQMRPFLQRWPAGAHPLTVSLLAGFGGSYAFQRVVEHFQPDMLWSELALTWPGMHAGYFWQLFTHLLYYQNPVHFLCDMVLLFFAGKELEPIIGSKHLGFLFFTSAILGGMVSLAVDSSSVVMGATIGSLAALAAYATILPNLEIHLLLFMLVPITLRIKVLAFMVGLLALVGAYVGWFPGLTMVAVPIAFFSGWLYTRRLGYGSPLPLERRFLQRRARKLRLERMATRQFLKEEIDPILEKIHRVGIKNLTRQERRILQMGSDKMTDAQPPLNQKKAPLQLKK